MPDAGSPGSLDSTFGDGGIVIGLPNAEGHAVVLQSDGKIVVAGHAARPDAGSDRVASLLVRLHPDGTIDQSFGANGVATTALSQTNRTIAAAVQPDGKILAAGWTSRPASSLIRYNSDGSLDSSFADGGIAFRSGCALQAVAVLPNFTIVAGGFETDAGLISSLLVRYLPDGTLDPDFGEGGIAEKSSLDGGQDQITALVIAPDRKVVTAGFVAGASNDFLVRRYTTDGHLDPDFGNQGVAIGYPFPDFALATGVALQDDGKIVVVGSLIVSPFRAFTTVRYQADGTLDTSFASTGAAITPTPGGAARAHAVAIQRDGKIVVAGYSMEGHDRFTLIRYQPDGTLDLSYGNNGIVVSTVGLVDRIYGIKLDADSKATVVGFTSFSRTFLTAARYLP
jgi:uncharacterized delta-60 repeat protein